MKNVKKYEEHEEKIIKRKTKRLIKYKRKGSLV